MSDETREFRFFRAIEHGPKEGRRTRKYQLQNRRSGLSLGWVKWHAPWRQFCFFPSLQTIWSDECLEHVRKIIEWAEKRRKEKP